MRREWQVRRDMQVGFDTGECPKWEGDTGDRTESVNKKVIMGKKITVSGDGEVGSKGKIISG